MSEIRRGLDAGVPEDMTNAAHDPLGLGNVILPPSRCPPEFKYAEKSSHRIGAPRRSAWPSSSNRSTPAPALGTKPHAPLAMGCEARSGTALYLEQVTYLIASKPAQIP